MRTIMWWMGIILSSLISMSKNTVFLSNAVFNFHRECKSEGVASTLLASAYNFNWKTAPKPLTCIGINPATTSKAQSIINLALAITKSKALANGRGDIFGSPDYFVQKAE